MAFTPYISFNGNCEEAMTSYARIFGMEEPSFMRWKDAPEGAQHGDGEKIMHASLMDGEFGLMGADVPGNYQQPQGVSVTYNVDDEADGKRVFEALSDGGEIAMPFGPVFFSKGFGMVRDKFGVSWMVVVDTLPE